MINFKSSLIPHSHTNSQLNRGLRTTIRLSYRMGAFVIALLFFLTSCEQYELDAPNQSKSNLKSHILKSTSSVGEIFIESIQYVNQFEYIEDESKFDPFIYAETGIKEFDTQVKLVNRVCYFYNSLNYDVNRSVINEILNHHQYTSYSDIASTEVGIYASQITYYFEDLDLSLSKLKIRMDEWKDEFLSDNTLSEASIESLKFNYELLSSFILQAQNNGAIVVGDLGDDLPGLPCGWSVALYCVSLVLLCATPVGWAFAGSLFCFGGALASVLEGC